VTAFQSVITQQRLEINTYYWGQSTGKEGKEEGNGDHIEELSEKDEEQEEGKGDSSAED